MESDIFDASLPIYPECTGEIKQQETVSVLPAPRPFQPALCPKPLSLGFAKGHAQCFFSLCLKLSCCLLLASLVCLLLLSHTAPSTNQYPAKLLCPRADSPVPLFWLETTVIFIKELNGFYYLK